MTLQELKIEVDAAIERAKLNDEDPAEIVVTLQINRGCVLDEIWSADEVELHYDGNIEASGCVLTAFVP